MNKLINEMDIYLSISIFIGILAVLVLHSLVDKTIFLRFTASLLNIESCARALISSAPIGPLWDDRFVYLGDKCRCLN